MQESNSSENTEAPSSRIDVIRHRARTRLAGRYRYLLAAAALLGLTLAGAAGNAIVDQGGQATEAGLTAAAQQARADAAQRGDRFARSPAPQATTLMPSPELVTPEPGAPKPKPKPKPAWVSPLPGAPTTSCFGMRWGVLHAGIDLAEPAGTPIHAAAAGTVVAAGWAYSGYGISVMIAHGSGFFTHYAHQSRTIVRVGQRVAAGQIIGYEGSTGDSTGPHLHFEVHRGLWHQIDPAPWMRARGVNLGC